MIETALKSLDQKAAGIKVAPAPAPSRGFALWVVLLVLYFLLLPSAAETGASGASPADAAPPVVQPAPGAQRR